MKNKKIPNTPKYKFGGFEKTIFTPDKDDKQKMKKFGKQAGTAAYGVGEGLLDTVTMGATDQITDQGYYALQKAGNSTQDEMREQDSIRGFSNAAGAIGGAIINPGATGTAISQTGKGLGAGISKGNESKDWAQGAGMALNTAGQIGAMAYGQAGSPMSSGMQTQAGNFNASSFGQGLDKYNKFANQGGGSGQMGGILNSFMGGGSGGMGAGFMSNLPSGTPPLAMKYGGQMKFGMGGMQYANGGTGEMNAEVEGGGYGQDGENAVAPGGEFTQFNGPTHAQGGIQTDMAPGTRIFSDKLKAPGTNKSFAELNKVNDTVKLEKKFAKLPQNTYTNNSKNVQEMGMLKSSDMLFAMQEQLKKDKVAAYAKKMGVELPPMDNEQMEPQGEMPMARHGGMFAMGGVQLPYYNTNNAGNPIYAMGGGYPAMTNPYHNFKGSIPMYQDGGNMPLDPPTSTGTTSINRPLKVSEVSSYGKTGYDEASMKNKDEKFEVYNNPDYLIQNQNIDTGKWNDFQSFLGTYKLPTGESYIGNKAGNTKLANDYTNLALSDYNKSLSEKYKNNPDAIKRKSVGLGDIEEVQKYYNQGDPNVPVDRILGSKTTQFRYPHFSSVSQYKAKAGEFVPVTYGGKEYVVDAETYNNKIVPVSEGKSDENVTKYFQSYDPRKHQNLDEKNAETVNRLGTMQGGSGSFTKKGLGKLPTFIYRNGQGTYDEQWKNYQKENGLAFKYGGQMPMPKFWGGGDMPSNFNFERSRAFNKEQNQKNLAFNQMTGNTNPGFSNINVPQVNNVLANNNQNSLNLAPNTWNWNAPVTAPTANQANTQRVIPANETGVMNLNQSSSRELNPNSKNFNWGNLAKQGANFLGQNMGNIYDLTRKNEPLETYDLATARYMDPTKAIAGENYIGRQTKAAIPGLVGGSAGAAMALLGANKAGTATRIGRLRETYDNANAQIGNQVDQYNTGIKKDQSVARAANAAALENVRSKAMHSIGSNFGEMTKSGRQDNTDQDTLKMFQWRYKNEPGFKKYIDNFSTQNNSEEGVG